jgi:ribokinase
MRAARIALIKVSGVREDQPADRFDVVVLGSANMDLTLRVAALPAPGETVLGEEPSSSPGGKGANQAVAAARAGVRVAFVGCVGGDPEGAAIAADLAGAGVSTTYLQTSAQHRTGLAVVLVGPSGENQIAVSPGANHQVRLDDAQALLGNAGVLLVQLEVPLDVVRHAIKVASDGGTRVLLNLSPATHVDADTLRMIDVLIVNRSEAAFLLDLPSADGMPLGDIASRLRRLGPAAVVLTAGAAGAVCAAEEGVVRIEPLPVTAVDTTGAGDAFAGALAAELSRGAGLAAAATIANAAGAAAVQRHGARNDSARNAQRTQGSEGSTACE